MPETKSAPSLEVTRILIVEDNSDDEQLLLRVLKKANMDRHVQVIGDGQQAIDYVESKPVEADLVALFLDLHLPGASGIEVLKKVRASSWLSDLPVFVMATSPSPKEQALCQRLGVSYFLQKPISLSVFRKVLADTFHRTGL